MNSRIAAHLALLFTNIFFAINFSAVKYLLNHKLVEPFGLNVVRVGVTAFLLWILFFFKTEKTVIKKQDTGRFILCALTGIALNQLLFLKGLWLTYSIHASLLMLVTPIIITLVAAFLLKEKLTSFKIIGLFLGLTGAAVLISSRNNSGGAINALLGDILVILNAISYAFYFILVKPLMEKYNPIMVLRVVFTIGFFMVLPFGYTEFIHIPWASYTSLDFVLLSLIVFGGTFLAYLFNIYGIKTLGASIAGTYIYSQPFFAAVIAMFALGEKLSLLEILAGALIFAGVYLSNKRRNNSLATH